uniref:TonB-dependent receptor n=1 Tax=Desulfobacca acetoxidans TaxID=60893 RepID=A0A7V4G762_9BACT
MSAQGVAGAWSKGRRAMAALAAAIWWAGTLWAAPEKVEVLEEVAVSASRTEMRIFDTPQSVTVLTEEDIKASPFERVEDIVRQAAGVFNFRHYALHTNGVVSPLRMRGVGNNRTLLLVDGVPQNDNFNNAIAWVGWGFIPKDAIQRIEIVRGPMSALYGSEGLGGVINVITKKPQGPRETSVAAKFGNGDTYGGDLYYCQGIKNFGLLVAGGLETSRGFVMDDPEQYYSKRRYGDMGKILGKASYDFTPQSNLTFTGLYYLHDQGQGREFFNSRLALDHYWLTYTHKWEIFHLRALTFLNRAHKIANQDQAKDNYTTRFRIETMPDPTMWGVDLQGSLFPLKWATFTAGLTYKNVFWTYDEDYTMSLRSGGSRGRQQFLSPFFNTDLKFFDGKLLANFGMRYDWIQSTDGQSFDTKPEGGLKPFNNQYDSTTWKNFSPKGGLVFHPDGQTALKASAGTGFRAPSLFELYKTHVRGGGTYLRFPNPFLNPEKITSYDVSAERFFFDQLLARVTFYQSWARDYIGDRLIRTYTKGKPPKKYYEYKLENISRVNIHGLEVELEWNPRKDLKLFANYTYNISKIAEDIQDPRLVGNYLPNDPVHKFHFGILYKNPTIANIYLLANFYDRMYYDNENKLETGGYFTLDASIYRTFFDYVTLRLDVENIFNRKYPLFKSVDSATKVPGTLILGKVILNF